MAGRLIDAWAYTWPDVWEPLSEHDDAEASFFMDLFPILSKATCAFRDPVPGETRESWEDAKQDWDQKRIIAATDSNAANQLMRDWTASDFQSDAALALALESAFRFLHEPDAPDLSARFFELAGQFLGSRNLRYRLVPPFELRPTASGLFVALIRQVEHQFADDADLMKLVAEFEHALKQTGKTQSEADIKTCIGKASNLAEGLAKKHPQAGGGVFSQNCSRVRCWPHKDMQAAFDKVYGFCSGYPGIRHSGSRRGVLRDLNMRDGIVAAIMLLASSGYFIPTLDLADIVG